MLLQSAKLAIFLLVATSTLLNAADLRCLQSLGSEPSVANVEKSGNRCEMRFRYDDDCTPTEISYYHFESTSMAGDILDTGISIQRNNQRCNFNSKTNLALDGTLEQFKRLIGHCSLPSNRVATISTDATCMNKIVAAAEQNWFAAGKPLDPSKIQVLLAAEPTTTESANVDGSVTSTTTETETTSASEDGPVNTNSAVPEEKTTTEEDHENAESTESEEVVSTEGQSEGVPTEEPVPEETEQPAQNPSPSPSEGYQGPGNDERAGNEGNHDDAPNSGDYEEDDSAAKLPVFGFLIVITLLRIQ